MFPLGFADDQPISDHRQRREDRCVGAEQTGIENVAESCSPSVAEGGIRIAN